MSKTWDPRPIIDWLLVEGRLVPDINELVLETCNRMYMAGAAITRVRVSFRTLHPLVAGFTFVWEAGCLEVETMTAPHGLEQRPTFIGSPMQVLAESAEPFRKSLRQELSDEDHRVLHELKAAGTTDYYGFRIRFLNDKFGVIVFTTTDIAGFGDEDLAGFHAITDVLAPTLELHNNQRVAQSIAHAYLGKRTGEQVLSGRITRGDVETIRAAVLVSDIRGWSDLNQRLKPAEAIALANAYFEHTAKAIGDHDGEILKFLGDGLLAIFPVEDGEPDADACNRAYMAGKQALTHRGPDLPVDLAFGIGLHFGEVQYGNAGSHDRLDFTVLGHVVNTAARIESQCAGLGQTLLFSETFAANIVANAKLVTGTRLKGLDGTFALYTG